MWILINIKRITELENKKSISVLCLAEPMAFSPQGICDSQTPSNRMQPQVDKDFPRHKEPTCVLEQL